MEFPENILYTEQHEYAKVEGGTAYIGISDYAQEQLGDITYIEMPEPGDKVSKGDSLAVIEAVKAASDLYSPLSGEILEVNSELEDNPELVNKDAYGKGWIVKIKLADESELSSLMDTEAYKKHVE
ncbi:MAG: glycine cleavage system protein GcvH [Candidatus Delongbacteria bacterium]